MKTCLNPTFQVPNCYGYWGTLLHEEEEDEEEEDEEEEDEESLKSCFTCISYLVWYFHSVFCIQLLFYMFSALISLKDRLRLKLKVKTEISLCMAIMLDNPWQSPTVWYNYAFWRGYGYRLRPRAGSNAHVITFLRQSAETLSRPFAFDDYCSSDWVRFFLVCLFKDHAYCLFWCIDNGCCM